MQVYHAFFLINLAACSGEYPLFSSSCNRRFGGAIVETLIYLPAGTCPITCVCMYMYVCMVNTFSRVWINRVWMPTLMIVVAAEQGKYVFPVPARVWEFGLVRKVRPSRPAPAHPFSTLWLNLVLTHGFSPAFLDGVHVIYRQPPTTVSLELTRPHDNKCVPMAFTAESPPTQGASNPQNSSSNGCSFSGFTMDQFLCASFFPNPLTVCSADWSPEWSTSR